MTHLHICVCSHLALTDDSLCHLAGLTLLNMFGNDTSKGCGSLTSAGWTALRNVPYLNISCNIIPLDALRLIWGGEHKKLIAPRVPTVKQLAAAEIRLGARSVALVAREERKQAHLAVMLTRREHRADALKLAKETRAARRELADLVRDADASARDTAARLAQAAEVLADTMEPRLIVRLHVEDLQRYLPHRTMT
jgi:hypothetical protein